MGGWKRDLINSVCKLQEQHALSDCGDQAKHQVYTSYLSIRACACARPTSNFLAFVIVGEAAQNAVSHSDAFDRQHFQRCGAQHAALFQEHAVAKGRRARTTKRDCDGEGQPAGEPILEHVHIC